MNVEKQSNNNKLVKTAHGLATETLTADTEFEHILREPRHRIP